MIASFLLIPMRCAYRAIKTELQERKLAHLDQLVTCNNPLCPQSSRLWYHRSTLAHRAVKRAHARVAVHRKFHLEQLEHFHSCYRAHV